MAFPNARRGSVEETTQAMARYRAKKGAAANELRRNGPRNSVLHKAKRHSARRFSAAAPRFSEGGSAVW